MRKVTVKHYVVYNRLTLKVKKNYYKIEKNESWIVEKVKTTPTMVNKHFSFLRPLKIY